MFSNSRSVEGEITASKLELAGWPASKRLQQGEKVSNVARSEEEDTGNLINSATQFWTSYIFLGLLLEASSLFRGSLKMCPCPCPFSSSKPLSLSFMLQSSPKEFCVSVEYKNMFKLEWFNCVNFQTGETRWRGEKYLENNALAQLSSSRFLNLG